jgi:uncharacterized OB-fold protein
MSSDKNPMSLSYRLLFIVATVMAIVITPLMSAFSGSKSGGFAMFVWGYTAWLMHKRKNELLVTFYRGLLWFTVVLICLTAITFFYVGRDYDIEVSLGYSIAGLFITLVVSTSITYTLFLYFKNEVNLSVIRSSSEVSNNLIIKDIDATKSRTMEGAYTTSTLRPNSKAAQVIKENHKGEGLAARQLNTPKAQQIASVNTAEMVGIVSISAPEEILLASKPSTPSEECWSIAIHEFDSVSRRAGLWARMFSEAGGNEAIAKASYLRHRADEVHRDQTAELEKESLRLEEQARETALAKLASQQAEHAKILKGACPNCGDLVPSNSKQCASCKAIFDSSSAWKITAFSESAQIEALRVTFEQGKKPTVNQVVFLAAASSWDRSLAALTDKTDGDTLLHWCAKYGLVSGAATLIANGASASATNTNGIQPFEVCTELNLRTLLTFAAYKSETESPRVS